MTFNKVESFQNLVGIDIDPIVAVACLNERAISAGNRLQFDSIFVDQEIFVIDAGADLDSAARWGQVDGLLHGRARIGRLTARRWKGIRTPLFHDKCGGAGRAAEQ